MDFAKYYQEHKKEIEDKYTNDGSLNFDKLEWDDNTEWTIEDEIENQKFLEELEKEKKDGNIITLFEEHRFVSNENEK